MITERPPAPPVLLPVRLDFLEERLVELLQARHYSKNPPRKTARFLAFLGQLHFWHDGRKPLPTHPQIAKHLAISLPLVDRRLSTLKGTGDISIRRQTFAGNVKNDPNATVERVFVIPSEEIQQVVAKAYLDLLEDALAA